MHEHSIRPEEHVIRMNPFNGQVVGRPSTSGPQQHTYSNPPSLSRKNLVPNVESIGALPLTVGVIPERMILRRPNNIPVDLQAC